jgi:hypothetical protein
LNLRPLSPRDLGFVIEAAALNPADLRGALQTLIDISPGAADRLVENAKLIGLLDASEQPGELASLIRYASLVERRDIIRFYLERFEPFQDWKGRIAQGFDANEASRLVKRAHNIDEAPAEVRDWMLGLGMYCGSVREEAVSVIPVEAERPSVGGLISDILNRSQSARSVLSTYVGEQSWEKLSEPVREHLLASLAKIVNNEPPDEAVREAGLAVDKFISDLGTAQTTHPYTGMTMGQSAQQLHADGVLVSKQKGFTGYSVQLRNGAEHPDTDPELPQGDRWSINTNTSTTYLRVSLDFIRSALSKVDGRYEL